MKNKSIGTILLDLRNKNKFTQDYVAEKIGISKMTYFRYENDIREPNKTVITKLADLYNVTSDFLLGIEDIKLNSETQDLMEIREQIRRNPATRTLFSLTKNATEKDIRKVIRMLEVLKDEDNGN